MITCDLEKDERMGWSTYMVRVDGLTICGITDQTDKKAVDRFKVLCDAHETVLKQLVIDAEKARDWNMKHQSKAKDWPAFRLLERFKTNLLKQAGVKDS